MKRPSVITILITSAMMVVLAYGATHLGDGRGWLANDVGYIFASVVTLANIAMWVAWWKEVFHK